MRFDLVIRNEDMIDGSGRPRYHAGIGVQGNRIAFMSGVKLDG